MTQEPGAASSTQAPPPCLPLPGAVSAPTPPSWGATAAPPALRLPGPWDCTLSSGLVRTHGPAVLTRRGAPQGHRSPRSLRTKERSKTIGTEQADTSRGATHRDVSGRDYDKSPTFRKNGCHLLTRVGGRPEQALESLVHNRTVFYTPNSCLWSHFPGGSERKVSACNAGDQGSIPGLGRSPGEGFQHSCLENPTYGGAWEATVHGVAKSRTRLSEFTSLHFIATYDGRNFKTATSKAL